MFYIFLYNVQFKKQIQMRYNKILKIDTVSEWRDAYINYQYLSVFIIVIEKIIDGIIQYEEKKQESLDNQDHSLTTQGDELVNQLRVLAFQADGMFTKDLKTQIGICQNFCLLKLNQITMNFDICSKYCLTASQEEKKKKLIPFLQYTYIQAVSYSNMLEGNVDHQRRVIKNHKKCSDGHFSICEPQMPNFIKELNNKILQIITHLQKTYLQQRVALALKQKKIFAFNFRKRNFIKNQKKNFKQGLKALPGNSGQEHSQSFLFGLFIGLFITVIIFMSLLLTEKGIKVQDDPIFNRDFPVWRGIAYIIMYIWVFGYIIHFFEKYKISHHILLDFEDHNHANSTHIFNIAGIFTFIYCVLFAIYALSLSDYIKFNIFPERYLGLIIWCLFFMFLFNPFPTKYHKTRIYIIKTIIKSFLNPLLKVPLVVIFTTCQQLALITSFQDFIYSVCYFTVMDFQNYDPQNNQCREPAKIGAFVYTIIVLVELLLQSLRTCYDRKKISMAQQQFWIAIQAVFGIITTILSYVWSGQISDKIFIVWIIFMAITTLLFFKCDLIFNFGLLDKKAEYWMLRDKITYSPILYYIVIIIYFVLYISWVSTLSPNIASSAFGSYQLFRLVTGGVEILRLGLWNLILIEFAHLELCQELRILPTYYYNLRNKIVEKLKTSNIIMNTQQNLKSQNQMKNTLESLGNIHSQQVIEEKVQQKDGSFVSYQKLLEKIQEIEKERKQIRLNMKQMDQKVDSLLEELNGITEKIKCV